MFIFSLLCRYIARGMSPWNQILTIQPSAAVPESDRKFIETGVIEKLGKFPKNVVMGHSHSIRYCILHHCFQ